MPCGRTYKVLYRLVSRVLVVGRQWRRFGVSAAGGRGWVDLNVERGVRIVAESLAKGVRRGIPCGSRSREALVVTGPRVREKIAE